MRWALIVVFSLAALGAWGLGFQASSGLTERADGMPLPRVAMRPLPELGKAVTVAKADSPGAPAAAAKAPEPTPVAAAAPAPTPVAAAVEKPPEKKEAPRPAQRPAAPAQRPAPVAEEPAPAKAAAEAPAAPAGGGDGSLSLKASDTAEIVIDGRKVGPSPKLGYKVKAGKHKIRFDCYDENGNPKAGKVQTVDVAPDADVEVNFDCPFTQ